MHTYNMQEHRHHQHHLHISHKVQPNSLLLLCAQLPTTISSLFWLLTKLWMLCTCTQTSMLISRYSIQSSASKHAFQLTAANNNLVPFVQQSIQQDTCLRNVLGLVSRNLDRYIYAFFINTRKCFTCKCIWHKHKTIY